MHRGKLSQAKMWCAVNRLAEEGKSLLPLTWLTISLCNRQRFSWETNWLMSAVRRGLIMGSLENVALDSLCSSAAMILQFATLL